MFGGLLEFQAFIAMPSPSHFDPSSVPRRDVARLRRLFSQNAEDAPARLLAAQAALSRRLSKIPEVALDAPLPITAHLGQIGDLLKSNQVVIVAGETGSGKTTQLPKLCLAEGFGRRGMIGHTQPRRLAARTVARRVAEELAVPLGEQVGYAVRFDDRVSPDTLIKVVTDGLLLAEIRRDRFLDAYDVVIVDEAHERSLNVDFLLGYLKGLLTRRRDLRLLITSATIDVEAFAQHFDDAPVVEVEGRGYPVEVVYQDDAAALDPDQRIAAAIDAIAARPGGSAPDVLLFQTGEREIFETSRMLRERYVGQFDVLPLYARLSSAEQNRVFAASGRRRIVVATNIAETSLTVPNIGFVVDPGEARISRYSFRSKLQRLPVEPISRASADQRMGRCGRIAPGVCFRLYAQTDFEARPEYTDPEIRRTNLASVVLQMKASGLGAIERFGFLDPPDPRAVRDAIRLLEELGALDSNKLTRVGRQMARLPVDPRLARMVVEAAHKGVLHELLIVVSGLAIPEPRERPLEAQAAADRLHAEFSDERSDFLALLNLWNWYEEARQANSRNALRRLCQKRFLSAARMREWRELHRQLRISCRELGFRLSDRPARYADLHRCVLTGSLSLVGQKQERGEYLGARQLKFRIFPGSGITREPRWLMAGEISETQRVYARRVAEIEPAWLESVGEHLLKRSYSEPHWSARRGETLCFEKVTLFGLVLVEKRRVSFKGVDRAQARDIFLKDGLVAGAIPRPAPFLEHNLALVREVRDLEAKGRRRDLLADDAVLASFYDERIGPDVCDLAGLEAWRVTAEQSDPDLLFMARRNVLLQAADLTEQNFPSVLTLDGVDLRLRYAFAPGASDDGVSVQLPIGLLRAVRQDQLDWLVPGLFEPLCEQLVRGLPKSQRRMLAPLADKLATLCSRLLDPARYRHGRIELAIGEAISVLYGVAVPINTWNWERVDAHLRMNVQVLDERGRLLKQGRALADLVAEFSSEPDDLVGRGGEAETGLLVFPDRGIDAHVLLGTGSDRRIAYPALEDRGDSVALILCDSASAAQRVTGRGLTRLVLLRDGNSVRAMLRELKSRRQIELHFATLGDKAHLHQGVLHAAARMRFFEATTLPTSRAEFDALIDSRYPGWFEMYVGLLDELESVLARRFELMRRLAEDHSPAFGPGADALRRHLDRLLPGDFLDTIPATVFADTARYLDAMLYRWAHLQGRVEKDAAAEADLQSLEARIDVLVAHGSDPDWVLRHMLEELRVASFAQPVGTRYRVSVKRSVGRIEEYERSVGIG